MAEDDFDTGYTWESAYEKTWEALREDESGSLRPSVLELVHRAKRKRLLERQPNVRLGIMRHAYVIIDLSESMMEKDLYPTRQHCTVKLLESFVDEFFDQNPISQIGLIVTGGTRVDNDRTIQMDKRAYKVSELTGNVRKHRSALKAIAEMNCAGEPSLQNALELALRTLKELPAHTSREIFILIGNLSTCDPTNISATIAILKEHKISCNVVGLSAELHVCKTLCQSTGGKYSIILDEQHFKEVLFGFTLPPPATKEADSNLVKMGFPKHEMTTEISHSMCICHSDVTSDKSVGLTPSGYFCPQCKAKYCSVPVECKICRLTLVSGPQLARCHQHLFPLAPFAEVALNSNESKCFGCDQKLEQKAYVCSSCEQQFCIECDLLLHESLQTCPGCAFRK